MYVVVQVPPGTQQQTIAHHAFSIHSSFIINREHALITMYCQHTYSVEATTQRIPLFLLTRLDPTYTRDIIQRWSRDHIFLSRFA